jgi:mannose-6-phosphate isomerase
VETNRIYPLRLVSSLHETIWGGRRLGQDGLKTLPEGDIAIGESWETEVSNVIENGSHAGKNLGTLVEELGDKLLGSQAIAIFGLRFPLLAKFMDANAKLSVQVHPKDDYANDYEGGKLGKTEFWYILNAEPGATIIHGFQHTTNRNEVRKAIQEVTLDQLMHEEPVKAGDVVFVPAGTVHAIGSGILLYELQEYSDVTYRMYDYGRLTASGKPRELHIDRSLDVSHYTVSPQIKVHPVEISNNEQYTDRCLVACKYFVTHEIRLQQQGSFEGATSSSCIILSSLDANAQVLYGENRAQSVDLSRGQTVVLPAALGRYRIVGEGSLLLSYVPEPNDQGKQQWSQANKESIL